MLIVVLGRESCDECCGRPSVFAFHIHSPWTEICQSVSLRPCSDCKVMGQLPRLGERVAPHSWGGTSAIRCAGTWRGGVHHGKALGVGRGSIIAQVLVALRVKNSYPMEGPLGDDYSCSNGPLDPLSPIVSGPWARQPFTSSVVVRPYPTVIDGRRRGVAHGACW